MSKSAILNIKNINLFQNENPEIQYSLSRDNKVTAQYSAYERDKGFDLRGVRAKSKAGKGYIRLTLSLIGAEGSNRQYFQGALFKNEKKDTDKAPDFRGSFSLDNSTDGEKLALSAWIKEGEKAGRYMSIAISEFRSNTGVAHPPAQNGHGGDPFDMDNNYQQQAPAPAQNGRSNGYQDRAPAQAPAPAQNARPGGYQSQDRRPAQAPAPAQNARPGGYQSQGRPPAQAPAPAQNARPGGYQSQDRRPVQAPAPAQNDDSDWSDVPF